MSVYSMTPFNYGSDMVDIERELPMFNEDRQSLQRQYASEYGVESDEVYDEVYDDTEPTPPTDLRIETIQTYIEAAAYKSINNRIIAVKLLLRLFIASHEHFTTFMRKKIISSTISSSINTLYLNEEMVDEILYVYIEELDFNFALAQEAIDCKISIKLALYCAMIWTQHRCPTFCDTTEEHIRQTRSFIKQLDKRQLNFYYMKLSSYNDSEFHKYMLTQLINDTLTDDPDFIYTVFICLFCHNQFNIICFVAETHTFTHDMVISCIIHSIANKLACDNPLGNPLMWSWLCKNYGIDTQVQILISQIISKIDINTEGDEQCWISAFEVLMRVVKDNISSKDFNLFVINSIKSLIIKANYNTIDALRKQYMKHLSNVRFITVLMTQQTITSQYIKSAFNKLTFHEQDQVFTAMCIKNEYNIAIKLAALAHTSRYFVEIANDKIINYHIAEVACIVEIFDEPHSYGFIKKNITTLNIKVEECCICMNQSINVVTLSCHPTHQVCETCCYNLINQNMMKNCPLCRCQIIPYKCTLYVNTDS